MKDMPASTVSSLVVLPTGWPDLREAIAATESPRGVHSVACPLFGSVEA